MEGLGGAGMMRMEVGNCRGNKALLHYELVILAFTKRKLRFLKFIPCRRQVKAAPKVNLSTIQESS